MIRRLITAALLLVLVGNALAQAAAIPAAITARTVQRLEYQSEIIVEDGVNDLAFGPDGTVLVTAGNDTAVRMWSLADNSQIAESYEHFSFVKGAVFTETVLATSGWDRTIITWEFKNGELAPQTTLSGFDGVIEDLAVSPDGARIAFGVGDGRVRIADVATGVVLFELPVDALRVTAVAFSPNGADVATAGGFPSTGAQVWDAATGNQIGILGHPGQVTALAYSPDGETIAASGEDGTVTLWQESQQIASLAVEEWITDIAYSPDGSVLAAARQDGVITFWDVTTPSSPSLAIAVIAADQSINAIAFSPDGTRLGSASKDGSVRLWQVK